MTRLITLTEKGKGWQGNEMTGRHKQMIEKLATLTGKVHGPVGADELRKSCRALKPKRFRAILRQLAAVKVVKIARA